MKELTQDQKDLLEKINKCCITSASGVTTDTQPVNAGSNPKKRKFDHDTFRGARDRLVFQTRHMYPPTAKEYFDQAGHYYQKQKQQIDMDLRELDDMRKRFEDHVKHIMWKYADMTREEDMRCVEYDRLPEEIGQLDSKLHMVKTKFPKLSPVIWDGKTKDANGKIKREYKKYTEAYESVYEDLRSNHLTSADVAQHKTTHDEKRAQYTESLTKLVLVTSAYLQVQYHVGQKEYGIINDPRYQLANIWRRRDMGQ